VGPTPGEAHESAIKEAETDAMKRALSTFGNPFGLALYDREQQNVRGRRKKAPKSARNSQDKPISWLVLSSEGEYLSTHEDPVDYCKAMRQLLEAISTRDRLRAFWQRNLVILAMLRQNLPDLKTEKGEHYAEILTSLYKQQMRLVTEEERAYAQRARELEAAQEDMKLEVKGEAERGKRPSWEGSGQLAAKDARRSSAEESKSREQGVSAVQVTASNSDRGKSRDGRTGEKAVDGVARHIDKSKLPISVPRRIRDKEHLRYVASKPCIICGRSPGHAHHLRYAQPRAMGRKVSDEWTVPLCSTHHRSLHSCGNEKQWWAERGLDPIAHAVRLWRDTQHCGLEHKISSTLQIN